eukprot:2903233-Ditylum_brightwellii.AAC.1
MDSSSITHIHSITSKIGILVTGLTADCCTQVHYMRYEAKSFLFKYGYDIPMHALYKHIVDIVQVYTQSTSMQLLGITCPFKWQLAGQRIRAMSLSGWNHKMQKGDFIMVMGWNGALGQAVIQLAALVAQEGFMSQQGRKLLDCIFSKLYVIGIK